jgi:hypothetical protein
MGRDAGILPDGRLPGSDASGSEGATYAPDAGLLPTDATTGAPDGPVAPDGEAAPLDSGDASSPGTDGAAAGPCSPSSYGSIVNTAPLPADFCAYAYLPFRAHLPASPQSIDASNTAILQQQYIPNSVPGSVNANIGQLTTLGAAPTNANTGNSYYPVYIASSTDPLVSVNCAQTTYGCSDTSGNSLSSISSFHIPAWARPSSQFGGGGDENIEVIQPNGDTALVYGCPPTRDWQDGDVIGTGSAVCLDGPRGGAYGSVVSSPGTNAGNINGGDDFVALPAHYAEVTGGQINHALVVFSGCFTGSVYPGRGAAPCNSGTGIPSGSHLWLSLTHAQIDALPTSTMPAYMRVFAYAAHDYGIYTFDTGDGNKWISQPMLEDALPFVLSGASTTSFWTDWFKANGGGLSGDANLKLEETIDWRPLAQSMYVLQECYARGACSDSVPP